MSSSSGVARGIATATRAAESGIRVGIVDDNATLGGQIWRGDSQDRQTDNAGRWTNRFQAAGVTPLCGMRISA